MKSFAKLPAFRRLLIWLDGNGGEGYGCVELNTAAEKRTFIRELKESLKEAAVEVDFSPDAEKAGYEDAELIAAGNIYETIRNFERKYPEKPVLIMTGLERTVSRDDKEVKKLASVINMNRDNFYRYPAVVLFIFPNWFMDVMLREAFDFTSAMGFHEDMAEDVEAAMGGKGEAPVFFGDITEEMPAGSLYDSYAARMRDSHLPAAERLEAAAKMVGVINRNYLRTRKDKGRIREAENLLSLASENEPAARPPEEKIKKAELSYALGTYWRKQGDPASLDKAHAYLKEALTEVQSVSGGLNSAEGDLYNAIGIVYERQKRYEEALACYEKVISLPEEGSKSVKREKAAAYNNLSCTYFMVGDKKKALEYGEKALDLFEELRGVGHSSTAVVLSNIGVLLSSMGDDARAMEYYDNALSIIRKTLGPEDPGTANMYYKIALSEERLGDRDEAYRDSRRAFEIMKKALGAKHPDTKIVRKNLMRLEREMKRE